MYCPVFMCTYIVFVYSYYRFDSSPNSGTQTSAQSQAPYVSTYWRTNGLLFLIRLTLYHWTRFFSHFLLCSVLHIRTVLSVDSFARTLFQLISFHQLTSHTWPLWNILFRFLWKNSEYEVNNNTVRSAVFIRVHTLSEWTAVLFWLS